MISPLVSNLTQPLVRPLVDAIGAELFGSFNPTTLFASSTGYIYDLNDLTTVFQDSAGTVAGAINQPVGLVLDKSQEKPVARRNRITYSEQFDNAVWTRENVTLEANKSTAPDGTLTADRFTDTAVSSAHGFRNTTAFGTAAIYTASIYLRDVTRRYANIAINVSGAYADGFVVDLQSGTVTQTVGTFDVAPSIVSVGGGWYRVSFSKLLTTNSFIYVQGALSATPLSTSGRQSYLGDGGAFDVWGAQLELGSSATEYQRVVTGFGDWIAGNHRYQTTAASRPTLRGTPTGANLVTNGDFASGTGWTLGTGWAISGGKLNATAVVVGQNAAFSGAGIVAGRVYRVRYTVSGLVAGGVGVRIGSVVTYVDGPARAANGTYEDYLTATANGGVEFIRRASDFTGSIDDVVIHDVSADSVTTPYGLQMDGTDDFHQTAPVNFTATDKMTVCHGVRKLSDAANGTVAHFGDTLSNANGSWFLQSPGSGGITRFQFSSRGTASAAAFTSSASYNSPFSGVVVGECDIAGDIVRIRVNGVQVDQRATDQGTGNYGTYPIYFGRRTGTSEAFNGLEYSSICVGKAVTAAELANIERWVAQRTGVVI